MIKAIASSLKRHIGFAWQQDQQRNDLKKFWSEHFKYCKIYDKKSFHFKLHVRIFTFLVGRVADIFDIWQQYLIFHLANITYTQSYNWSMCVPSFMFVSWFTEKLLKNQLPWPQMAINYNFRGVGVRISLIMAITSSVKQLNVFFS